MGRFSSDFDNPVLKFGLTFAFPFTILLQLNPTVIHGCPQLLFFNSTASEKLNIVHLIIFTKWNLVLLSRLISPLRLKIYTTIQHNNHVLLLV